MSGQDERAHREAAYYVWEREGRPAGCAAEHWHLAARERDTDHEPDHVKWLLDEEEKAVDGRPDVNFPALLTKDVPGG